MNVHVRKLKFCQVIIFLLLEMLVWSAVGAESFDFYRAVTPKEYNQIVKTGSFENPKGIEGKCFSTNFEGAKQYAEMAETAFGDEPYVFIKTSIPKNLITDIMKANVDSGIDAVLIPTVNRNDLSIPKILDRNLENGSVLYANP